MLSEASVLQERFVPADIVHREDEIETLRDALPPTRCGGRPAVTFLFGPTGVGKTCVAKHTVRTVQGEGSAIDTTYVNCWQDYSRFGVLYRLLEGIDAHGTVHRQSTPKDELFNRLREHVSKPYVVILDEVDQLAEDHVLYDLYRIPEIALVCIANDKTDVFPTLDTRVRSRLESGLELQFDRYSRGELVDILSDRVETGLEPGVISEKQLRRIAALADGDARVAIGTLRAAVNAAHQSNASQVTDAMITDGVSTARRTPEQQCFDRLNDHQQALLYIVEQDGPIAPGELYTAYTERVSEPRCKRTVRKYLRQLEQYELLESDGEKRGRTYDRA